VENTTLEDEGSCGYLSPKLSEVLEQATALITSGKLSVPVAATYPLSAIKAAVAHVERGGKVLLDAQKD
jgi:NADPH:quinone reductase-like Zn-dependent oxidoreductase